MKIRPHEYVSDPVILEGELPGSILELNEKSVRGEAPIHVHLTALPESDGTGLLIQGTLKTTLKVECGRCLDWIDWPIEVTDFTLELKKPQPPVVDLTPHIREDIILHLPFNAACKLEAGYRCPLSGKTYPPASTDPTSIAGTEVWQELDKLKIKE